MSSGSARHLIQVQVMSRISGLLVLEYGETHCRFDKEGIGTAIMAALEGAGVDGDHVFREFVAVIQFD